MWSKWIVGAIIVTLRCSPSLADEADTFARFWAGVLAVEDRCNEYYSLTDATIGGHLEAAEYRRAVDMVEELRPKMAEILTGFSCQQAAEQVAELGGLPFLKVWER